MTGSNITEDLGLAVWRLKLPRLLTMGETAMVETTIRLAAWTSLTTSASTTP